MEPEHYYNIYTYLTKQQTPQHFTKQQKQQLLNQSKNYTVESNLLYKKDKKILNQLYRVIQKSELPALLYMMHNDPTSRHFSADTMFTKIKTRYYWPQYYENIKKYVESCDAC
jgi:esterase/lipase